MKRKSKIKDHGRWLTDESYLGNADGSSAIVMDCIMDREKRKPRIKTYRTNNVNLLAGQHTVAIFKIKYPVTEVEKSPN